MHLSKHTEHVEHLLLLGRGAVDLEQVFCLRAQKVQGEIDAARPRQHIKDISMSSSASGKEKSGLLRQLLSLKASLRSDTP